MDLNKTFIDKIVYPVMENFKGNNVRKYINELKSTQNYNYEELKSLQSKKLINILIHCIDNVPAYKKLFYLKEKIYNNPYDALKDFDILTKKQFIENSKLYITKYIDTNKLISNTTGGSTGEPVKFFIDRYTVEHYEAARWRGLSWWGITPSDRSVMIWGSPIELSKSKSLKYKIKEKVLKNRIVIPAYSLNPERINLYVDKINSYKPIYIYGYASSLYAFAQLMLKNDLKIKHKLKGILSTAENLYDYQRKSIENAFGAPVINEYGARDGGIIAYQCSKEKMHIMMENLIIEIVDIKNGERLNDGNMGSVLITDLNNFAMPRIRYMVGDMATISTDTCECGLELPVLNSIEGRVDEMFLSKNGDLVHGHYWNHIARNMKGIRKFQLIQHDKESVSLKIVKSEIFDVIEIEKFKNEINKVLGVNNIKIIYCEDIKPSSSGKLRYAIREFPLLIE